MLTFGSLFAGIGGFDLGLERAGLRPISQCEIDKDCQKILKRHWSDVRLHQNVKEINRSNATSPDVLVGGFPCQDLSIAGKREGLAGKRSGLWFEFHRIIGELKPRWVVIENVPGLLSSESGRDFAVILRGLAECGYHAAWRVLDAQYFGVAQRRRRVFIVASLGNGSCAQVLFEREGGAWDSAPSREAGQRIAGTIAAGAHPGSYNGRDAERDMLIAFGGNNPAEIAVDTAISAGRGSRRDDFESETFVLNNCLTPWDAESKRIHSAGGIAPTLAGSDGKGGQRLPYVCNAFNGYTGGADDNDAQGWHDVPALTSNGDAHSGLRDENGLVVDIAATLRSGGNGNVPSSRGENLIPWHENKGGSIAFEDIAKALRFGASHSYQGVGGVRRLTPTECERLQGFPDGWTEGQSDSARYRQLGNAVAVPCSQWIGQRIIAIETP